ncbi:hypothetical protein, partial [Actinacidiphila oryziradicis]|uniref:hypothetical protein n=1 Tax=Actinacidiphila oryziradicis TaxID=2571141 RepID=UPI0023F2A655
AGVDLELDKPRDLLLLGRHCSLRVLVRVFSACEQAYRTTIAGIMARPETEQVRQPVRACLTWTEVRVDRCGQFF